MDIAVVNDLEDRLGKARVRIFAGLFRDQVSKAVDAIASTADRHRIAQETHDLLSLAGSLGCIELTACSRTLMEAARHETGDLGPLVAEIVTAAHRALTAMHDRYPS